MSIPSPNPGAKILRFSVFEVDLEAGELRKKGARIRLQEQPFQVLIALLQNAGQVVTRETLRRTIWNEDTFVDFDHSLNTAINKIRESLGDSASSPRFVETLARRGYRFLAPVEQIGGGIETLSKTRNESIPPHADSPDGQSRPAASTSMAVQPEVISREVAIHPELHVPIPRRGVVRSLFALSQVMYLTFYLCGLAHLRGVENIASSFLPGWRALAIVGAVFVTGAVGIPLRFYLLSSIAFDFRRLGDTFLRLFPFVLALDQLWAITPFLLLPKIGVGLAFAGTAALLYVPFSERTLIRMAYPVRP